MQLLVYRGARCRRRPRRMAAYNGKAMAMARRPAGPRPVFFAATTPGSSQVWAVGLTGFCSFLDVYVTQPILPYLGHFFHASPAAVGLTISAVTLAMAIAAPLIGILADRMGRKRLIVTSLLLLVIPTFLAAQAPGLAALVHWRFVQGLLVPGVFVVTMAYVTEEWADGRTVAFAMAIYIAGTVLGGVCGRFLTAVITAAWGWRTAFEVLAGLTILLGLAVGRLLPPSLRFERQEGMQAAVRAAAGHLRNRQLLATFVIGFNLLFMLVAMFTYVSFHLAAAPFRLGAAALGFVYFAYLPSLAIIPSAGNWTGRVGQRRALVLALLATGGGALLTLWPALAPILIGLAIGSGGLFIAQTAATSYLGIEAETARSSAVGLYSALYYVGGSLGGVLPGLFWHWLHWNGCIALVLIADTIAIVLGLRGWRRCPGVPALGADAGGWTGWMLGRG